MFVSHRCRFIVFIQPATACPWLGQALAPWVDQHINKGPLVRHHTMLFRDMTPPEAELAFDLIGWDFGGYTKIAVVENPFKRMSQLYDRIAQTDPAWRLRRSAGFTNPPFSHWLQNTKPDGVGAGTYLSPRWRRLGAWSADAWAADKVDHFVRAEHAASDLLSVFRQMQIAPAMLPLSITDSDWPYSEMLRYDAAGAALIKDRYRSDLHVFQRQMTQAYLAA